MATALGIIPARFDSTRFPGKPLAPLSGKPMLQHVYERASSARRLSAVWVATDDARIYEAVKGFGGKAVMTDPRHSSGSDRVAEAAALPEASGAEVIVNVQGDQPLIAPEALDALVAVFDGDSDLGMATLYEPLGSIEDLMDPNVAKVVADRRGDALYFSRSPVPFCWRPAAGSAPGAAGGLHEGLRRRGEGLAGYWKHVGVYAFRREFLFHFKTLDRGILENLEGLEQLRALEAGYRIRLVRSAGSSVSVETPADLSRVQSLMSTQSTQTTTSP